MTITKVELVKLVMQESHLSKVEASNFINQFFEVIIQALESSAGVKISGFGNFMLRNKSERIGRNPKTREKHIIKARRVVSFKSGSCLKSLLKTSQDK